MEWLAGWPWGLILILIVVVLWGHADSVADGQKAAERVRGQLHAERLAAIAKGLPPPDSGFDEALLVFLAEGGTADTAAGASRAPGHAQLWAILFIAAGVGWFLACLLTRAQGPIGWVYEARMFGIIPVMLGLGVLLHLRLSRTQG